jgi:hypothetical protein
MMAHADPMRASLPRAQPTTRPPAARDGVAAPRLPYMPGVDGLRALAVAHWARLGEQARPAVVSAADGEAARALAGWGLTG